MSPTFMKYSRGDSFDDSIPSLSNDLAPASTQGVEPNPTESVPPTKSTSKSNGAAIACGIIFPTVFLAALAYVGLRYRRRRRLRRLESPVRRLIYEPEKSYDYDTMRHSSVVPGHGSVVIISPATVAAAVSRTPEDLSPISEIKIEPNRRSSRRFSDGSFFSVREMFARPKSFASSVLTHDDMSPATEVDVRSNRWSSHRISYEMDSLRFVTDMFVRPESPVSVVSASIARSETPSDFFSGRDSGRDSPWTEETVPTEMSGMSEMVPPQPAHLRFPRGRECLGPSASIWSTATAGTLPSYCSTPRSQEWYMEGGSNVPLVAYSPRDVYSSRDAYSPRDVYSSREESYIVQPVF